MSEIIRLSEVKRLTGLSKATIWRQEKAGKFPSRIKLTDKAVGWHRAEIEEWIATRAKVNPPP